MKKVKKSKSSLIKEHLLSKGNITTWEAIKLYRETRLSARIFILRDRGWVIETKIMEGKEGSYAKYVLLSDPKKLK